MLDFKQLVPHIKTPTIVTLLRKYSFLLTITASKQIQLQPKMKKIISIKQKIAP